MEEDDDWVVDCLIGYLRSPLWRNPVDDFVEQHCIVFDQPDGEDSSYTDLHSAYQSMIEELLNGFIADVGISWDQLSVAITKSKNLRRDHAMLLQPILASEQLNLFKKIMHQRNVVLERQALQMLQRELGQQPEPYQETNQEGPQQHPVTLGRLQAAREEEMLQKVLEMSKKDFESKKQKEDEEMEKLVELAKQESLKSLGEESKDDGKLPTLVVKKSIVGSEKFAPAGVRTSSSIPLVTKVSETKDDGLSGADAAELWMQTAKMEVEEPVFSTTTQIIPEDPVARKKYLSRQRDRLLESKRKARANELKNFKASAKPFGSKTTWKPKTTTTGGSAVQTTSYKKISEEGGLAGTGKQQDDTDRIGKGGLAKKTGVLCSAIAEIMDANETDL